MASFHRRSSRRRGPLALVAALLSSSAALAADPPPLLHPLFAEHVVLQRDRPIGVWGFAPAGQEVVISLGGASATTRADAAGRWSATLPALPGGGPYELEARTGQGATQTVRDVRMGDVWLCSGQSNMALPVSRSLGAAQEVARSQNDLIRAVTIPLAASPTPLETFAAPLSWKVAGPATTGGFSAACYYFARDLQGSVRVPMGLVVSAWGGSKIEPWIAGPTLRKLGGNDVLLDILAEHPRDPAAAARKFGGVWQEWWKGRAGGAEWAEPWKGRPGPYWRDAPPALGFWETWGVPELVDYDGIVLYRTSVTLTAEQARRGAVLSIGAVDEIDVAWVNGTAVGSSSGGERAYRLPAGLLRAGENVVVVSALDTYLTGGINGPAEKRALVFDEGDRLPLSGRWQYLVAPEGTGSPPRAPWESTAGLGTISNAMIAPLGRLAFRGALWYQGESNAYLPEAEAYQRQLAGLMADWRARFGADLPFLVVQLANYGGVPTAPVESGWAQVRDGQRRAVAADGHAALAVAIDIGEPYELHPANKQELGRRLARGARRVVYGEPVTTGPQPLSARRQGAEVVVAFGGVEGSLLARSGKGPTAFELCGSGTGTCRYVIARLQGDHVVLDAAEREGASRVRYCWADAPVCTLVDASGLPAPAFELEIASP
jgi:sialate O-acetylesterase